MSYNPSPRCCISHNWQNNSTSQIKLLTIHDRDAKGSSGIDILLGQSNHAIFKDRYII